MKFLCGIVVGSTVEVASETAYRYLCIMPERSERMCNRCSALTVYSSGLFKKLQSLPAPETNSVEPNKKTDRLVHRVRIGPPSLKPPQLYTNDTGRQIWFKGRLKKQV